MTKTKAPVISVRTIDEPTNECKPKPNLRLPRILCLHGGGSNARIFHAQTRVLRKALATQFRFVFADAPFASEPGPDVMSAYSAFGPFRRWLRSGSHHPQIDAREAVMCIEESIYDAMDRDDLLGGTGDYVGVIGFSQGAKLAASLLFRQQVRTQRLGRGLAGTSFRFAVIMNGRGPLVSLDPDLLMNSALADASEVGLGVPVLKSDLERREHVLRLPTVHVHGLSDPGLALHQRLLFDYCSRETAKLVEWEGAHRVPVKSNDVAVLVQTILHTAKQTRAI